ncbi:MAG: phosphomannomutase/phosphoglucomutase, partial [Arachnia sp.]
LTGREFVLGRDMRVLGRELSEAFADGARGHGAGVVDIGLTSTDQLWFASGWLDLWGVQFTASHNPPQDNGIKFCLPGARPVPEGFTAQLRRAAATVDPSCDLSGGLRRLDTLEAYAERLNELVPATPERGLQVVVDAGNGMAGNTCLSVLAGRGLQVIGLFFELDGTFPNHPPNPLDPANLRDAQAAVLRHEADLGLVFDGDADRCFVIDERGAAVDPSAITAMIALEQLRREPGGTIVVNTITSHAVADAVAGLGSVVTSRVGHTFVKAAMSQHEAVFGGEHSAHYYFRDFWYADTGMLAALHVMELLRRTGQPLSQLVARFDGYWRSGEINHAVADATACQRIVADAFHARAEITWGDGLLVSDTDGQWWFSLRASNTEPLLRLNVEAVDQTRMAHLRDEVLRLIRGAALD